MHMTGHMTPQFHKRSHNVSLHNCPPPQAPTLGCCLHSWCHAPLLLVLNPSGLLPTLSGGCCSSRHSPYLSPPCPALRCRQPRALLSPASPARQAAAADRPAPPAEPAPAPAPATSSLRSGCDPHPHARLRARLGAADNRQGHGLLITTGSDNTHGSDTQVCDEMSSPPHPPRGMCRRLPRL